MRLRTKIFFNQCDNMAIKIGWTLVLSGSSCCITTLDLLFSFIPSGDLYSAPSRNLYTEERSQALVYLRSGLRIQLKLNVLGPTVIKA